MVVNINPDANQWRRGHLTLLHRISASKLCNGHRPATYQSFQVVDVEEAKEADLQKAHFNRARGTSNFHTRSVFLLPIGVFWSPKLLLAEIENGKKPFWKEFNARARGA